MLEVGVQVRRAGAGTVLLDPISGGEDPAVALRPIADVLATDEWILHSADQDLPCLAETVVDGDRDVPAIGAASIIAKVTRDRLMRRLAVRYPGNGWETNVGYATSEHREAVQRLFPGTQITFGPATEDGFYYDFAPRERPFTEEDLPAIEEAMRAIIAEDKPLRREVWSRADLIALDLLDDGGGHGKPRDWRLGA